MVAEHLRAVDRLLYDNLVENYTLFDPLGGIVQGSDADVSEYY